MTTLSPTAAGTTTAGVSNLATGDVRIPVHPPAGAAVARRADQPYQAPAGLADLRTAIARRHAVDPAAVVVAPGARIAILCALTAVLSGGRREVLLTAPHWPSYLPLIHAAGGVAVTVPSLDPATLDQHAGAAVVVVNSPRNPDGVVVAAEALRAVRDWAARRGVVILADEVYRGVPLDPAPPPSALDLAEGLDPHCIVIDGLSKSHALAGLRVGWAVVPPRWAPAVTAAASHLIGGTCTIAQNIAVGALDADHTTAVLRAALNDNLLMTLNAFAGIPGVRCARPAGGIFVFPDLRDWLAGPAPARARADLAGWLRDQHGVQVVDGRAFGAPGHMRVSFAVAAGQLVDGLDRIRRGLLGRPE